MESEITTYTRLLDRMREDVREVLLGLYGAGLNWRPLPTDTNSVYALAQHSAWVEDWWIGSVAARAPFPHNWDNDEDLASSGDDPADLLVFLDQAAVRTAAFFATLDPDELGARRERIRRDGSVDTRSVRYCIVHTIEHYSEHIGQMRLTRQLWEAGQNKP
ncbi:MAG: DUF664 domain-containing protein [Herpetosiphonaceae bacterium]|nr:DUF664 domain-containing protein [Herpetosiphonaceae bacterium]